MAAGAGGMYCGSCLHDNTLAAALIAEGHEVALLPTYTPLRTDEVDVSRRGVFYGAVNVYLQQKLPLFRRTPRALDRLLDRPRLLGWVGRLAGATDARDLGALTLSVLQGEDGHQRKELERLLDWLAEFRPEVVQLTNAFFLGVGTAIRRRLGVPVVCGLTGEDLFMEELREPYRGQVVEELRRRAGRIDGFVATSRYYADAMSELLRVERSHIHVVPLGIHLEGFAPGDGAGSEGDALTIGYLARICPEKGLELLVEAFRLLAAEPGGERLRLAIAGYLGKRDAPYLARLRERLAEWGLAAAVEVVGEVDRRRKLEFLQRIDLLSVPATYREPKGLYVLEALACGVPVVQPRHGAFPELIEATGGGLLVDPGSAPALAAGLRQLIDSPQRRWELGSAGRRAVVERFGDRQMARRTAAVYESLRRRAPVLAEALS